MDAEKNDVQQRQNDEEDMDTGNDIDLSLSLSVSREDTSEIGIVESEGIGVDPELDPDEFDDDVEEPFADSDNEDGEDVETQLQGEFVSEPQTESQTETNRQTLPDTVFGDFSFAGTSEENRNIENRECLKTLSAEAEKWVSQDTCNTALVNSQKSFVCVKYPGVIRNKDRALATLGGISEIMEARTSSGKLDLKFRPEDPYCKSTIGVYKKNNHLLLRCRRRKVKNIPSTSSEDGNTGDGYEYKIEVIGVVDGIFSFQRPCDFQYLPVAREANGSGYKEILSKLVMKFEDDRQEFMNRDVPCFLPAYAFSRSEKPAPYLFQNDEVKEGEEYIGASRKPRSKGTQRIVFATEKVPDAPNNDAIQRYEKGTVNNKKTCLDPLIKLFEERPLWTKVGIIARLKAVGKVSLKNYVNMVAYLFGTGPWIHMWCKFGYDPRKDPKSKIYQTVDFRLRKAWNREKVQPKRGTDHYKNLYHVGINTIKGHRLPPMGLAKCGGDVDDESGPSTSKEGKSEDVMDIDTQYQFVPDRLPPYRQMYYQVCDVFEDKIQTLAHQNDGQEVECTERDGWCVPDFLALSRDILAVHADNLLS